MYATKHTLPVYLSRQWTAKLKQLDDLALRSSCRRNRQNDNHRLLFLQACILLLLISLFLGTVNKHSGGGIPCQTTAVILHFLLLAEFMATAAHTTYLTEKILVVLPGQTFAKRMKITSLVAIPGKHTAALSRLLTLEYISFIHVGHESLPASWTTEYGLTIVWNSSRLWTFVLLSVWISCDTCEFFSEVVKFFSSLVHERPGYDVSQ